MTNTQRVLEAFQAGEKLTAKQITARFGVANPRSVVHSLRMQGYPIYLNGRKNAKGETVNRYVLGTPTRRVIAAGYRALAMGL